MQTLLSLATLTSYYSIKTWQRGIIGHLEGGHKFNGYNLNTCSKPSSISHSMWHSNNSDSPDIHKSMTSWQSACSESLHTFLWISTDSGLHDHKVFVQWNQILINGDHVFIIINFPDKKTALVEKDKEHLIPGPHLRIQSHWT